LGVVLRRLWSGWERALIVVRPAVSPAGEDRDRLASPRL
jgi:hypothetical protein